MRSEVMVTEFVPVSMVVLVMFSVSTVTLSPRLTTLPGPLLVTIRVPKIVGPLREASRSPSN